MILQTIVIISVPVITAAAVKVFTTWRNGQELNVDVLKNNVVDGFVEQAEKLVTKVVKATNQTFVNELKLNGGFDSDKMKEAFSISYDRICALMSKEMEDAITETYGDISKWLTTYIEAAVLEAKTSPVSVLEAIEVGGDENVGN